LDQYGISFSKKAIAVYKNSGEFTGLHELTSKYQQQNQESSYRTLPLHLGLDEHYLPEGRTNLEQ